MKSDICLSFKLTWINVLLTTSTTLVLAIIGQYCFDVREPATPLGYFFIFSLPCYLVAMICIALVQFLNFKRSKWLLPMSVVVIAAIFVFSHLFSMFTYEGLCTFQTCFNWKGFCNPDESNSTLSDFSHPVPHGISLSVHVAAIIAAVVIATASTAACCCTYLCHKCCQKSYENSCFPMTNKIKYDTSNL